jgi:replicative DNA helicase
MSSNVDLFNTENEVAVLSILLSEPDKIFELDHLKTFMFSSSVHQILFETLTELSRQGTIPEVTLLKAYLSQTGKLDKHGGVAYLEHLKSRTFNSENLLDFERLIVNSFKGKSLLELSSKIPGLVMGGNSVDGIIDDTRVSLDALSETTGYEDTEHISKILRRSFEDIVKRVENPGVSGVPIGIKDIDTNLGGIVPGEVWIVASRPSMGKSAVMCNSSLATARKGNSNLIFSYEMPKNTLIDRFLALETKIGISDIRLGTLNQKQMDELSDAIKVIDALPIYIDTNFSGNIGYLASTIRRYHRLHDTKIVYLDYIQLMAERDTNATNELGQISRELKLLANNLGIAIIIFSQLNRLLEARPDKRPILSDLRQSGNLEEDADVAAFLYRDEYYNKETKDIGVLEFIIRKNRNGPIGTIPLMFEPTTTYIYCK